MSFDPEIAFDSDRDLSIARIIRAPRSAVWQAWADPRRFEKWWVPAPALCHVVSMELAPGGAFVTEISENGGAFVPHMNGCILAAEPESRIVFTDALQGGWRPSAEPFITAIITFRDHPDGTDYAAHVMHRSPADRDTHLALGFHDGWGTVADQLARVVEAKGP